MPRCELDPLFLNSLVGEQVSTTFRPNSLPRFTVHFDRLYNQKFNFKDFGKRLSVNRKEIYRFGKKISKGKKDGDQN